MGAIIVSEGSPAYMGGAICPVTSQMVGYTARTSVALPMTQDRLWVMPFYVPKAVSIDILAINVTTAAASSVVRLGVYRDGDDLFPDTLLTDAGTVATATTGEKQISSLAIALTPGTYWMAAAAQGGNPSLSGATTAENPLHSLPAINVFGWTSNQVGAYFTAGVTGALPATFPQGSPNSNSSFPRIGWRVA